MVIIENLRRITGKGNLRAFCDVRIPTPRGDWVIRGCRIIQQPRQMAWFSLPIASWRDENGKTCFKTMLEIPARLKKKIGKAALKAYSEIQVVAA